MRCIILAKWGPYEKKYGATAMLRSDQLTNATVSHMFGIALCWSCYNGGPAHESVLELWVQVLQLIRRAAKPNSTTA
jgi:hypothetical protein